MSDTKEVFSEKLKRREIYPVIIVGPTMEYNLIMAQELCRHLQRCLKHEDVARQLILRDLNPACEQWACGSLQALTEDM